MLQDWNLKKHTKERAVFHKWKKAFHEWQEQHQPVFITTEKGLRLKKISEPPLPPILNEKEHTKTFWRIIKQAKNLEQIRNQLKDFGIELDPGLSSKKSLILRLEKDPVYFRELTLSYLSFRGL